MVHYAMNDLLVQRKFVCAHLPEVVELAVIATGLGVPRNRVEFVKQVPSFWDSTAWTIIPRPFLDIRMQAYANALAAWVRGEKAPKWADQLEAGVKGHFKKSLNYLFKTGDSFFQNPSSFQNVLDQPQADWLAVASGDSNSKQIIALRHFERDETLVEDQERVVVDRLRSQSRDVVLNAIVAAEQLASANESLIAELQSHIDSRDEEIQSKSMTALARMSALDDWGIEQATKMLNSSIRHVIFAGMVGLSTRDEIGESAMRVVDRAYVKALQTCDYEFAGLFSAAYSRWLDEPMEHVERLLTGDDPEYLEIARESFGQIQNQVAAE